MLTRMTDADWTTALEVFRAVRSRRGDKGRDDRRFLEGLHDLTVQSVTWPTLPAEFGNWKRLWRLRENGTTDAFFEAPTRRSYRMRSAAPASRSCSTPCASAAATASPSNA